MTHQRHHLPRCDRILVLRGGRIVADGSFQQLQVCCTSPSRSACDALPTCGSLAARLASSTLAAGICIMPVQKLPGGLHGVKSAMAGRVQCAAS